jgi:hypothetical protein
MGNSNNWNLDRCLPRQQIRRKFQIINTTKILSECQKSPESWSFGEVYSLKDLPNPANEQDLIPIDSQKISNSEPILKPRSLPNLNIFVITDQSNVFKFCLRRKTLLDVFPLDPTQSSQSVQITANLSPDSKNLLMFNKLTSATWCFTLPDFTKNHLPSQNNQ